MRKKSLSKDWITSHGLNCCMDEGYQSECNTCRMSVSPGDSYWYPLCLLWASSSELFQKISLCFCYISCFFCQCQEKAVGRCCFPLLHLFAALSASRKTSGRKDNDQLLYIKLSTSPVQLLQDPLSGLAWWPITPEIKAVDWSFMKSNINKLVVWNYLF